MSKEEENLSDKDHGFVQEEDFNALYANNVQIKPTIFDLKLVFGEIDQQDGKIVVEQHTSMTIPWVQAKLLVYYLQVTIFGQELEHGPIHFPAALLPPEPPPPHDNAEQGTRIFYEYIKRLRAEFITKNFQQRGESKLP
jgi:hypothetical protein